MAEPARDDKTPSKLKANHLRICLVSGEYPPQQGGVGDYTALLARHISAAGHSVVVVTSGSERRSESAGAGAVWRIGDRWGYRAWRTVGRQAAGWRADLLHVQYQAAAYGMHPAANLACLLMRSVARRIPIVVTFHDLKAPYLYPKAGPLRQLAIYLLAATADACIVTNAADAHQLRRHVLASRTPSYVIPIGTNIAPAPPSTFDREAWRSSLGVKRDEHLIGYFGFWGQSKGVDLLIEAVSELVRRGRRIRLLMIGGTAGDSDPTNAVYVRKLQSLAGTALLADRLIWTGFADQSTVSAHLLAADLCVLPFREGASYRHGTLVAALAHGLPIITTYPPEQGNFPLGAAPLGGVPVGGVIDGLEPLVDGENVILVRAGNVHAIARAIEGALDSKGDLSLLRAGAKRLAHQFEWAAIASRTTDLYRSLLQRHDQV